MTDQKTSSRIRYGITAVFPNGNRVLVAPALWARYFYDTRAEAEAHLAILKSALIRVLHVRRLGVASVECWWHGEPKGWYHFRNVARQSTRQSENNHGNRQATNCIASATTQTSQL